jgi:16S rRNA C967 or C1407 C5-methylase (RsmB/RsmF family)/NOL1/NOP2/fmu family ribosome biogenesis protein
MENLQLPEEFKQRMKGQLSADEFDGFIKHYENPAPVSIRLNPLKDFSLDANLEEVPWAEGAYYLPERPIFTLDPAFHGGAYYVQEAASMFIGHAFKQLIDPEKPIKILDLSAAPGGKSTHLASLMNSQSLLVANEVIRARAGILEENLVKWGCPNIIVTNSDPSDFSDLENYFDLIVIDAPCSGEGMFRKDPDACNQWSEANVKLCAQRQERIFHDVLPALKPGGHVIYSTCTFSTEENEENVKKLLEEEELTSVELSIEESWGITTVTEETAVGKMFAYRFYPNKVKGEGFFISCMQKQETNAGIYKKKIKENREKLLPKALRKLVEPWLIHPESFEFLIHRDEIYALPKVIVYDFYSLDKQLKIKYSGTRIGRLAGNDLIPSHELALSIALNTEHVNVMDLTKEQSLEYLRKIDFIPKSLPEPGWTLIRYKGVNLGWVKVLKNRINNYFPVEMRIRMKA